MISDSHISNENEIIVAVSFHGEVGLGAGVVGDKKLEKNEKREKGINSNSKMNIKADEKCEKCEDRDKVNSTKIVKVAKKREELSINNYDTLLVVKYKIDELKKLCAFYKLSRGGNKDELTKRLYEYCKNSVGPLKIQKVFRGFLNRKLHKLQGPALMNRKICTNDTDFFTMDDMIEIPVTQFYSYKDDDDFVYGFNIVSLYNLIKKEGLCAKNPYNRSEFDNKVNGNYANSEWFSELSRNSHIRFARELVDIWNYRALLTVAKKVEICPPHGNPFLGTPYYINIASNVVLNNLSIETLVKYNVQIIENLVKSAVDIDNKMLGTFYVLSALTLVSQSARDAMPWLYDAVVYIP